MPKIFSEKDKERIKERLLCLGMEQLKEKGYKEIAIEEIARLAGIAKGTFYHFFSSKELFFYEVLIKIRNNGREKMQEIFQEEGLSDQERTEKYLRQHFLEEYSIYDYFKIEDINIIFRRMPEKLKEAEGDSGRLTEEVLRGLKGVNDCYKPQVVHNLINMLGIMHGRRAADRNIEYVETLEVMIDTVIRYVFSEQE